MSIVPFNLQLHIVLIVTWLQAIAVMEIHISLELSVC